LLRPVTKPKLTRKNVFIIEFCVVVVVWLK